MVTIWLLIGAVAFFAGVSDGEIRADMNFYYDPPSQYFLLQVISKCYIAPLTREEKDHVHSHQGIEDLELTYVREWLGVLNETLIYHNDASLPTKFAEMCKYKDIYYINRKLPPSPSISSIIG